MKAIEQPVIGLTLNYRDATRTSRCLASLLDDGVHKVLVWDNSEDDGKSAGELRQLWAGNPRVDITVSPRNLGFAIGVNRGIETILHHHPTAWILLINNDAVLRTGGLSLLVEAHHQNTHAVIAYPRIAHGGRVLGTFHYQRYFALLSFDKPLPGSFPYASGCTLLIAPERAEMPLFDEDFFMYGEDAMLGWRLGAQRMAYVPEVLVDHEGSATSGLGSEFYETRLVAGHWLLGRKLARNPAELTLLTLGRTLSLTARALVRSCRFRSALPIRALWQGWKLATGADPALQRAKEVSCCMNNNGAFPRQTWSRGALQYHDHCPLCGSRKTPIKTYCRQDDHQAMPDIWCCMICSDCGSIYLNPRPDAASLPLAYADYYTHHASEEPTISARRARDKLVNGYLAWRFGMIARPHWHLGALLFRILPPLRLKLDVYGRHIPKHWIGTPRKILDVGCGNGDFLRRVMEMGFDAVGCEPDSKATELCRSQGLNVLTGDAFNPMFDDMRFDFITLNHVIEHVDNPHNLLKRLHDLLKPKGLLWLALPNPQALGLRVYGKAWKGFHPPFHLQIPHQKILKGWLREASFTEITTVPRGAQSPGLWRESHRIALQENCAPAAWIKFMASVGGDLLSTLTPRWGEETIIMAKRVDTK